MALVQPGDIADSDARQAASEALTATVAGQRPDLVVWGESSVGQDLGSHPEVLARLAELSRRVGADLLVNVDAPAPGGGISKSAVLIGARGSVGSYRKTRLVPFGEYVPLRPLFGWITRHSKAAAEDRQRGTGPVVLHAGALSIGPLVSYETIFSDLARREARLGAELLVYQSSTSSFQGSWAQPQLAAQPAVRAVEAGRAGGACRIVRRQLGLRLARPPAGLVPVGLPGCDRGQRAVGIGCHAVPTARGLGAGGGVRRSWAGLVGLLFRWHRVARSDTLPG